LAVLRVTMAVTRRIMELRACVEWLLSSWLARARIQRVGLPNDRGAGVVVDHVTRDVTAAEPKRDADEDDRCDLHDPASKYASSFAAIVAPLSGKRWP